MKKVICLFSMFMLLGFPSSVMGQDYKMNHAFMELAGSGKVASLNYERYLYKNDVSIRVGYGLADFENATLLASLNYFFKTKSEKRFWQVGLGTTYSNADLTDVVGNQEWEPSYLYLMPTVGHRWKTKNNYTFQIAVTPFIRKEEVFPWGGFSFGKQF